MAKSAKGAETKPLSFAERQLKVLLERLRNHLRHTSGSSLGRVSRKRKEGPVTLSINISAKGYVSISLEVKANNGTGDRQQFFFTLDNNNKVLINGNKWSGNARVKWEALNPAYSAKVIRHNLDKFFPGYFREREEWTPPLRPVNERFLPIY